MKFRKLVCLALVCTMIVSLSFLSLNVAYASEGEIYFVQNADGSYRFGYGVETADYYFDCEYIKTGSDFPEKKIYFSSTSPSYSMAQDRLAYFNYINGGRREYIDVIKFGGVSF